VAREISKMHEEITSGMAQTLAEKYGSLTKVKGEIV